MGKLVLRVDRGGGYSLRGTPKGKEGDKPTSRDLIVVGVVRPNEIVAVRPEEHSSSSSSSSSSSEHEELL